MTKHLCLIILSFLIVLPTYATTYSQLGQRPSQCTDADGDLYDVELDASFKGEVQSHFKSDRLNRIILAQGECLRVGSEIKLSLSGSDISYLGRAFVSKIEILSASELVNLSSSIFSKKARQQFVSQGHSGAYARAHIEITEKISESYTNTEFERLPSCFPAYSNWDTHRLSGSDGEQKLKEIQSGQRRADIWNGSMNCYKVGIRAKIYFTDSQDSSAQYGSIIPRELFLVHISNLTEKHAKHFHMTVDELRKSLEADKYRDGGYVSMVVYDYEALTPNNF